MSQPFLATSAPSLTAPVFKPFNPRVLGLYTFGIAAVEKGTDNIIDYASISVQVVPEPSTYVLMGLGLMMLGAAARARRRSVARADLDRAMVGYWLLQISHRLRDGRVHGLG